MAAPDHAGTAPIGRRRVVASVVIVLVMVATVLTAVGGPPAEASDGVLDVTYTNNMGGGLNGAVQAIVVQPDGKVVIGGEFTSLDGSPAPYLARLNADGTPDLAFSAALGSGFTSPVNSLALAPDGKIVVGGTFVAVDGVPAPYLARLNADGSVDEPFTNALGPGFDDWATGVAVQPDGKVVVVGWFVFFQSAVARGIVRLNEDGTMDAAFASAVGTGFAGQPRAVALQSDGGIVVGGSLTQLDGVNISNIGRVDATGTVDTSFASGVGFDAEVLALAVQPDGKIIAGGSFTAANGYSVGRLARLEAGGSLDLSFTSTVGMGFDDAVQAVDVAADGSIGVGGYFTSFSGATAGSVAQLASDGSLDTTFAAGSGSGFAFSSGQVSVAALRFDVQSLVAGGRLSSFNGLSTPYLARLGPPPPPPTTQPLPTQPPVSLPPTTQPPPPPAQPPPAAAVPRVVCPKLPVYVPPQAAWAEYVLGTACSFRPTYLKPAWWAKRSYLYMVPPGWRWRWTVNPRPR